MAGNAMSSSNQANGDIVTKTTCRDYNKNIVPFEAYACAYDDNSRKRLTAEGEKKLRINRIYHIKRNLK